MIKTTDKNKQTILTVILLALCILAGIFAFLPTTHNERVSAEIVYETFGPEILRETSFKQTSDYISLGNYVLEPGKTYVFDWNGTFYDGYHTTFSEDIFLSYTQERVGIFPLNIRARRGEAFIYTSINANTPLFIRSNTNDNPHSKFDIKCSLREVRDLTPLGTQLKKNFTDKNYATSSFFVRGGSSDEFASIDVIPNTAYKVEINAQDSIGRVEFDLKMAEYGDNFYRSYGTLFFKTTGKTIELRVVSNVKFFPTIQICTIDEASFAEDFMYESVRDVSKPPVVEPPVIEPPTVLPDGEKDDNDSADEAKPDNDLDNVIDSANKWFAKAKADWFVFWVNIENWFVNLGNSISNWFAEIGGDLW